MTPFKQNQELDLDTPLYALPHFGDPVDRVHLSTEEWYVLTLVLQRLNIGQIIADTGYSKAQALAIVARLIDLGLVVVGEAKPAVERSNSLRRAIQRRLES